MKASFNVLSLIALSLTVITNASGQALAPAPAKAGTVSSGTAPIQLDTIVVTGSLDTLREQIAPDLGATVYTINQSQIQTQSQGDNAPFNQTLLRAPGVAEDSFGQLHVRGEHANLQYRINDVLIPEGLTGFGQELDTRFLSSVSLITGSLPAQYGFHTAGIIDIHTKNGAFDTGGDVSLYGGSFNTINPSFQYGGSSGKWNYYFTGSFLQSGQGIENPANSTNPIHDDMQRYSGFGYLEYVIDPTSRFSLIWSGEQARFQIPNIPGQPGQFVLAGLPIDSATGKSAFDSASLNENQNEQNDYAIEAYQKTADDVTFQLSTFQRYSSVLFHPDETGDLVFNGVASQVNQSLFANGLEGDASWTINDAHTLRGGLLVNIQSTQSMQNDNVFPTDAAGNPTSTTPINIQDGNDLLGAEYGFYLQDEWTVRTGLTVNYGGRFDVVDAYDHENQLSPRLNVVWAATPETTLHAGYARYFTPPPQQEDAPVDLNKFIGTTNQPEVLEQGAVKAERSNYFDAGVTHQFNHLGAGTLSTGLDAYYKQAQNQLDDGQFGTAVILQPFNYQEGQVDGVEFTGNYQLNGIAVPQDAFNAYANFAVSQALSKNIISNQYEFSASDLAYINNHYIYLDHNQTYTGSFGISYSLPDSKIYLDLLYQNGLRSDADSAPNGAKLPAYCPLNLGASHVFHVPGFTDVTARFDIVNVLEEAYEIRDGTGVGVGAPQWGSRRGFYGGVSVAF